MDNKPLPVAPYSTTRFHHTLDEAFPNHWSRACAVYVSEPRTHTRDFWLAIFATFAAGFMLGALWMIK
jgi:hypothetical protein